MAEIGKRAEKLILRNDFKLFYDALEAAEYSGAQKRSFLPTITMLSLFSYQSGVRLSHAAQLRLHESKELPKAQLNSASPAGGLLSRDREDPALFLLAVASCKPPARWAPLAINAQQRLLCSSGLGQGGHRPSWTSAGVSSAPVHSIQYNARS